MPDDPVTSPVFDCYTRFELSVTRNLHASSPVGDGRTSTPRVAAKAGSSGTRGGGSTGHG